MNTKTGGQISDSKRLALLLAVSGGLMDVYTYIFRGKVFANAQTGNILLLGINLAEGNYETAFYYFFPIITFTSGIILSEVIYRLCVKDGIFHWRQIAILLECAILFLVGFFSLKYNLAANSLVSFACGIQVESFRKVKGNLSTTAMCLSNLRSGTQALCDFIFTKNKNYLSKAGIYYGIILAFVVGAVLGNLLIPSFGQKTIWCSCVLLSIGFFLMFIPEKKA